MDFVAFDFETGSLARHSAIEIGLARFEDGELTETYSTLLTPLPGVSIQKTAIAVHGLQRKDLKGAPEFSAVYKNILAFIRDSALVGHNVKFDLDVLCATATAAGLKAPVELEFACTQKLAESELNLPANKLANLCEFFGIENPHAHRALSDAVATGECMLAMLDHTKTSLEDHLTTFVSAEIVQLTLQKYEHAKPAAFKRGLRKAEAAARGLSIEANSKGRPKPFRGLNIVISGGFDSFEDAVAGQELIMTAGGTTQDHVNKSTNILVCGRAKAPTAKHKKALHFISKGVDIEIIDEAEFIRRLNAG